MHIPPSLFRFGRRWPRAAVFVPLRVPVPAINAPLYLMPDLSH